MAPKVSRITIPSFSDDGDGDGDGSDNGEPPSANKPKMRQTRARQKPAAAARSAARAQKTAPTAANSTSRTMNGTTTTVVQGTNDRSAATSNNNPNPRKKATMSSKTAAATTPRRTSNPLFEAAEKAATAGLMGFEQVKPSQTSVAATAALIDLAVDQWKNKQRQVSATFEKQVGEYLKNTEDACVEMARNAEERCTASLQIVMEAIQDVSGNSESGNEDRARTDDGDDFARMVDEERAHLAKVRELLVDKICGTLLDRSVITLAEKNSVGVAAQIEVHFQDRPRLLREQRRALVRKYRSLVAEHEASDETAIRSESMLQLLGELALL